MVRQLLLAGVLPALGAAQTVNYFGYTCPIGYHTCPNCCDIDTDCGCDQFCPSHPEVWTEGGCAVPKSNKGIVKSGDFVCPSGYKKCPNCCDIEPDCKCNQDCMKSGYPRGFDCSLTPGQDQYTTVSYGAKCPGGYTECSNRHKYCDLNPDCRQDNQCIARAPKGFRCTVPKRYNGDKTKMQGGRVEAFAFEKDLRTGTIRTLNFDQCEAQCKKMNGHLMSIHSNDDYRAVKQAVSRARITKAVFIGGYEKSKNHWVWIDGTPLTTKILNGLKAQDFGNNQNMGGTHPDENQMVYCSDQCVNELMGGTSQCPDCEGLHDWGNRQRHDVAGIGGYVCRVSGMSVGHVIEHRPPNAPVIYQEKGGNICTGSLTQGTLDCHRKATGWSNAEVTAVGMSGTVHGPWGKSVTTVTKSIKIPRTATGYCYVSWRSWAIDSRDGEYDSLTIDNKVVWKQKAQMAFRISSTGSGCQRGWLQGPADFPNPWGGGKAPACYVDRTVAVPCRRGGTMKVTFQSGVDDLERNEAWAFSDFSVHQRARPSKPVSIQNQRCTSSNFHAKINAMSHTCCSGKGKKCANGVPVICRADCAKAIHQLNQQCHSLIKIVPGLTNTMDRAVERCFHEAHLVSKGGSGCTRTHPCTECQGDCDADRDCKGPLTCFQRNQHQRPTGCGIGGKGDLKGYDYCVDPAVLSFNGPRACTSKRPCLACQGDCDNDAECKGSLKCQQRSGYQSVSGCKMNGRGNVAGQDFCYDPSGQH